MAQKMQGFGAALQEAYPLLLAMSNGLSSGQGVFSQAGPGLAAMMQLQDRRKQSAEEAAEKARLAQEQQMVSGFFGNLMGGQGGGQPGQGYSPPAPNPAAGLSLGQTGPANNTVDPTTGLDVGRAVRPTIPEPIKAGIFAGESGGDYDALFGYSNRPGGRYSDVRLTNMTVDQAIDFTNPSGDYGQWVKGQVGRVATPVGAYQIVGKTLRGAKDALGLTGNERMTPELQDQLGAHIYQTQGTGAWEGYRGPQTNSGVVSAQGNLPQGARPTQRAPQFDPNRLAQLVMSDTVPSAVKQLVLNRAFPSSEPVEWQRFEGPDGSVNAFNPVTREYVEIMPAGEGGGVDLPSSVIDLQWRAEQAGLQPGTPEYESFVLNAGGDPANFRALDMQAQAAGLQPGTAQYEEFMATRGAGQQAYARGTGANRADIDTGAQAEASRDLGAASMAAGVGAWEGYGKLQTSLANIDQAITAIDSGAESGLVYNMLPSVTEASASLENAMNRMGLDVVGATTFGALSEGELRLAMNTAVPQNLAPAELRNWLVKRRDAQAKTAAMLADAAQFLTNPNNTLNDWVAKNRATSQGRDSAPQPAATHRFNPETGQVEVIQQ